MSSPRGSAPAASRWIDRLVFFWLVLLLVLAPLIRGGNRQLAVAGLMLLGLGLLATLCARAVATGGLGMGSGLKTVVLAVTVTAPLWLGLLYLAPMWPEAVLDARLTHDGYSKGRHPLSLMPAATWAAVAAGVPVVAVLWASLTLSQRRVERLWWLLLAIAAVQLVIALGQLVQGPKSVFYFESAFPAGVNGTFNNRNHLADFFAMLLPVWLFLATVSSSRSGNDRAREGGGIRAARLPLLLFFGFSLAVAILATQSRGGLISATVVLVVGSLLFIATSSDRLGLRGKLASVGALLAFGALAMLVAGIDRSTERLGQDQLRSDADVRQAYADAALAAARDFAPWGTGPGSFEGVFPRFQAPQSTGYVDYAHNDYAQMLMELGAPGAAFALLLAVVVLAQAWQLWRHRRSSADGRLLCCYAGLGALALLLHSFVEFNMHIPALAITAALLLGIYLRPLDGASTQTVRRVPSGM